MAPDVLVVGAGLAGCSVAWHAAPHARVIVLEQGEQPGAEASAQNAGMVRRLGEDPWERALALRTAAWLADPPDEWATQPPSTVTGALLALAHDPRHLDDAVAHVRARGVGVEWCDRPAEVAPALRGSRLVAAWYVPDERVADAHALLTGFLRGARRHGATVRTRSQVHALVVRSGRCVGVRTDDGVIEAEAVVLAAGAWSAALAASAGLARPLAPVRRTLLQSAPHPLSTPAHPWTWIDDVGVYVRPEAGGFLVSPCDEAIDAPRPGPGSAGPVEPTGRALAIAKLDAHLPALAGLRLHQGWTGLRTFAPDRRPVLGPDPDLPGLHWAAGLGGFGVTCAVGVGEIVAAWLRGDEPAWFRRGGVSPGRVFPTRWAIRPTGDVADASLVDA